MIVTLEYVNEAGELVRYSKNVDPEILPELLDTIDESEL